MKVSVEGRNKLAAKLRKAASSVETNVNRAVAQVGEDLLGKAIPLAPLEHGPLRQSGYVDHSPGEAVVGFVHEMGVTVYPERAPINCRYEGRVFSIFGTSEKYPALKEAPPCHPFCKYALRPHVPAFASPIDGGGAGGGGGGASGGSGGDDGERLQNFERAKIPKGKLTRAIEHPTYGRVSWAIGFGPGDEAELERAIRANLGGYPAQPGRADEWGRRYTVVVPVTGPSGRTAPITTGWIYRSGSDVPASTTIFGSRKEWRRWEREGRL